MRKPKPYKTPEQRRQTADALKTPQGQQAVADWVAKISKPGKSDGGKMKVSAAQAKAFWQVKPDGG